jgi:23S rRNA-/tRNA-specific pseudouridylate synthase
MPPRNGPHPPDPRAHAHLGFSLVGDYVYGKAHLTEVFPRQALQARRLGLVHPATGEQCEWTVPLAEDLTGRKRAAR